MGNINIYIYSVIPPIAWALQDSTSFNPETVQVQAANIGVPIGTVIVWTKEEIPEGWLECNGQVVNADLYPDLADLMNSVPDYRDRFLQGKSGQAVGSKIEAGLPNIKGEITSDTASNGNAPPSFLGAKDNGAIQLTNFASKQNGAGVMPAHGHYGFSFDASRSNSIYGNSSTVQPPAVIVKYIIKAE